MSQSDQKLLCIYCGKNSFTIGKGSREHVILSALGGKKFSRNVCCEACNNRLGKEIDEPFAKNFHFISTNFGITTGRGKEAPTHKNRIFHNGAYYDLHPNGQYMLSKDKCDIKESENGIIQCSFTAKTQDRALAMLKQICEGKGIDVNKMSKVQAELISTYPPIDHEQLLIGGDLQFRSVAKMLLTYCTSIFGPEKIRSGCFGDIIKFISVSFQTFSSKCLGTSVCMPQKAFEQEINHRIFITASKSKGLVVGVFELFGNITYTVELSKHWDCADIAKLYGINPITHESEELEIRDCDFLSNYEIKPAQPHYIKNGLKNIINSFITMQHRRHIDEIVSEAMDSLHLEDDMQVTEAQLNSVINEIVQKFTRHILRIDSREPIDLLDSLKALVLTTPKNGAK